jgi:hypothetical protein
VATALDTKLRAAALRIIAAYGQDVVFVVPATSTYDPATGATTETSPTEYTEKISPPRGYKATMIDGDIVRRGDRQAYLAASGLSFTPKANAQEVRMGTEVWKIVGVQEIYSGEQIAVFVLQMRK